MRTQALSCVIGLLIVTVAQGQEARFKGGFPTDATAQKARDDADFERAVTAYRFWYPTVSLEGVFNGRREQGVKSGESITILSAQPHHLIFTANSDTPYASAVLDLTRGAFYKGQYQIELPPGPFVGLANDHYQGWIQDFGLAGPDKGKGGKYFLVPPGITGEDLPGIRKGDINAHLFYSVRPLPEESGGFFIARSRSNKVFIVIRALPVNGDVNGAMDRLRSIKISPYPRMNQRDDFKFEDMTQKKYDGTPLRWEDNLQYWDKLHGVIDAEPLVDEFRPMYGMLAALGIEKGRPFAPDARMHAILEKAAKAGREQMLVTAFASARPDRIAWPDRKWEWAALVPDSAQFETKSGLDLEARDRWFAQAILTSPAMFRRKEGSGSLYWLGHRDATGAYLDGGKTYKLTVPQPVPAKLFWSVTLYDAATRSQVQTSQNKAALRSLFELKDKAGEKPLDLYFGPKAPPGKEDLWIQTVPGRGWFAYFRIFGPLKPAFDGAWKPGDFMAVPEPSPKIEK
jgi:hypothetical protein